MSAKLQPVRGTHDILPEEATKRRVLLNKAIDVFARYGYGEIQTPIFEFSEIFHRTLGEVSDVVTKETYTFTDRGGESLTLRPEFTASVVRALISNSLQDSLPFKVFYHGPAFRYERPQDGRMRQFHQLGAELLGVADPLGDVEMIAMASQLLARLGLTKHVTLELNSLGDAESRDAYRRALVAYFTRHREALSEDSKNRLERNPLRVLDSKNEGDRKLIADAPKLHDYFTPAAAAFYGEVKASLEALNIRYRENQRLVRGLDYYSHTVFEFTTTMLGAQSTVLAGGRYDGLVKLMGGNDIPGVGFAAGIERLLMLIEKTIDTASKSAFKGFAVIPMDDQHVRAALLVANHLRQAGKYAELITRGNLGKKMKRAEKFGVKYAVIIGDEELARGNYTVKNMETGVQEVLILKELKQLK